jgi:hypothetical protein
MPTPSKDTLRSAVCCHGLRSSFLADEVGEDSSLGLLAVQNLLSPRLTNPNKGSQSPVWAECHDWTGFLNLIRHLLERAHNTTLIYRVMCDIMMFCLMLYCKYITEYIIKFISFFGEYIRWHITNISIIGKITKYE